MKFCESHWKELKQHIDDRGLMHLVAKSGEKAVDKMQRELAERTTTKESFDPLMSAHWAIVNNASSMVAAAGMNPLYLLSGGAPEKCDGRYGPQHEGREWSKCPLCYINMAHELTCTEPECKLDRVKGYDWMLDRSADDALQQARELGLVGKPS